MNRFISAIALIFLTTLALIPLARANDKAEFPTIDGGKRIFRCLITAGEFQEMAIYQMSNGTFRMTTLNSAGSAQAYEMPSKQWTVGKIEVPCSHDEKKSCGEVYANGTSWSYDLGSAVGDCR